jgi:Ca-activated chloride channel family protein
VQPQLRKTSLSGRDALTIGVAFAALAAFSCVESDDAHDDGIGDTSPATAVDRPEDPLDVGDATWSKAPLGEVGLAENTDSGTPSDQTSTAGTATTTATGTNTTTNTFSSTGADSTTATTTTWPSDDDDDDEGDDNSNADESEDEEETDSTAQGGEMCVASSPDAACGGMQAGVCEAGIDPTSTLNVACCDDIDCSCVDSECQASPCAKDGFCDCACQAQSDPDCGPNACAPPAPARADACPGSDKPTIVYMSNDDSNSQASPAYVRRSIHDGLWVDPNRVRIHEFLNYYTIAHAAPSEGAVNVGFQVRRTNAELGEFTLLSFVQARTIAAEQRPPLNLVFSLDTSGSMSGERLDLLKATVRSAVTQLRTGDEISLVDWSSSQSTMLDGYAVNGPSDPRVLDIIDGLQADGGTDLSAGLQSAYRLALAHYDPAKINRVFLVSDGGANLGETAASVIADHANTADQEGIYLIGVGVGEARTYSDALMDEVTDLGKGAYLFVDSADEAGRSFADPDRFLANIAVAARNVQVSLILPWYFGIKEFHGEELSTNPAEVEPQHLAPNDAMNFHQILSLCDPSLARRGDPLTAVVRYLDPLTREEHESRLSLALADAATSSDLQLRKADAIVAYAKSFAVIASRLQEGNAAAAVAQAQAMSDWLATAGGELDDREVLEMSNLMRAYAVSLGGGTKRGADAR